MWQGNSTTSLVVNVKRIVQQQRDAAVDLLGYTAPQNAMAEEPATKNVC
jgi:hypothetical protein